MPRYLSPAWFEAAQRAVDANVSLPASAGIDIVVQHVVTDTEDGDVTYHVRVAGDGVSVHRGQAPDPTVVFSEDYGTAAAISRGELSAQSAFITGRIKVRGDLPRLVEQASAFTDIDDALAGLRAETSY